MKKQTEKRNVNKIIMLLVMVICLSTMVSAFGMRPTLNSIDFSPGTTHEGQFVVTTNPEEVGRARLIADGDLAEYITLPSEFVDLGEETSIHYSITLPDSLSPGEHVGKILVEEDIETPEGAISAKIRLTFKIIVNVAIPEKHIKASIDVKVEETSLGVTASVKNVGSLDVQQVSPQITIANPNGEVAAFAMESQPLGVAQSAEFKEDVPVSDLKNGIYTVTAAIAYDEGELEVKKEFSVGVPLMSVARKDTKFEAGVINEFTFDVQSDWNEPLNGVVASVAVSQDGSRKASFASEKFNLDAREKSGVKTYFDASNLAAGTYDATVTLTYPSGAAQDVFEIELFGDTPQKKWSSTGLIALLIFNGLIAIYVVSRIVQRKPAIKDGLAEYVDNARKKGYSNEQIKQMLLKAGWPAERVKGVIK